MNSTENSEKTTIVLGETTSFIIQQIKISVSSEKRPMATREALAGATSCLWRHKIILLYQAYVRICFVRPLAGSNVNKRRRYERNQKRAKKLMIKSA